jgi:hypothetical protein
MMEEINVLAKNDTWKLTTLRAGKKIMGWKWVFVVKQKPDGAIKRFKARLVVKCFTQTFDIDYQETFALIAKMNFI